MNDILGPHPAKHGTAISAVEVTNVSPHGLWLLLDEREVFLSYDKFPWFREASIGKIVHVELPSPHHLYWPELDVDLEVESVLVPERYPETQATSSASWGPIVPRQVPRGTGYC